MKPITAKFIILLLFHIPLSAQSTDDIEKMLETAQQLQDDTKEREALDLYLEILELDSENYEALWNASLLYSVIGFRFDEKDRQQDYFMAALELSQKAVEAYPDSGHPHYVQSVAKGRLADVVSTRERIRLSHEIREAVQRAVEQDPDFAPSWHLYGVWHSEVANLSRSERIAARFISRGLPEGTNENAEEYLTRATELDPESILIKLDLARHYIRTGQEDRAVPHLEVIAEMEPVTYDDPDYIEEARELLGITRRGR